MSKYLTSKQVREILRVDRITVYRMIQDGRLKAVKIGKQWQFHQNDIDRFLGREPEPVEPISIDDPLSDFPVSCVSKVEEIFAGILGIGVTTVRADGEPLTGVVYANPFCQMVYASAAGRSACQAEWARNEQPGEDGAGFVTCHAGLKFYRCGVALDGKTVARVISGQFRLAPQTPEDDKRLAELAARLGIGLSDLQVADRQVPVLKKDERDRVEEWTPRLAATVQSILHERQGLMLRLQKISEMSAIRPVLADTDGNIGPASEESGDSQ